MMLRLNSSLILLMLLAAPVSAQFVPIDVDDPRPVEKVMDGIKAQCQCVITYEDPAYTSAQLVDMTRTVRKDGKSEPKVLGLPNRFMSFHYDPTDKVERNVELALQQARKDGAAFRLTRSSDMFHVIPEAGSILNTPVTGVLKQGSAFDVVRSILNSVSRARGTKIGLHGMEQLLGRTAVTLPGNSGTADQLLLTAWPQISKELKLTWKLLYEGQDRFYVFSVIPVQTRQR